MLYLASKRCATTRPHTGHMFCRETIDYYQGFQGAASTICSRERGSQSTWLSDCTNALAGYFEKSRF
jgi:hypothetical protein